ncbi:uncharacterized protein C6C3.02c-like [Cornus florida]|uniref:uncharacterized protein C6C3.02c-like n=1 Tax=Cornus florida TaxID=4283 RepID=UPI00289FE1B6|nr:uncharacterized protein C6C3.02c-like [Cornus florida]
MARRSRSFGGKSAPRPRAAASSPLRNPPKPVTPAPPPAPAPAPQGSALGGLGSVVAEGMAFGGGSAVAHRAVDAVMGPRVINTEVISAAPPSVQAQAAAPPSGACDGQSRAFQDCLNQSGSDIGKCQFYMDMLSECRKNSSSGLNV